MGSSYLLQSPYILPANRKKLQIISDVMMSSYLLLRDEVDIITNFIN